MIIDINGKEIECEKILNLNDKQIFVGHAFLDGTHENPHYTAYGVDENYEEDGDNVNYKVRWEVKENHKDIENEDEMCDWEEFTVTIN